MSSASALLAGMRWRCESRQDKTDAVLLKSCNISPGNLVMVSQDPGPVRTPNPQATLVPAISRSSSTVAVARQYLVAITPESIKGD